MFERDPSVDVLVVGAGPAGLALAADLARYGVRCRVVESRPEPRPGARCPNMWRRTLYALGRLGLPSHTLRAQGVPMRSKVFHVAGRTAHISLLEDPDDPQWPLPLLIRQDHQEKLLSLLAARNGCRVQRGVTARVVAREEDCVRVELRARDGGTEQLRAAWLVAADGGDSSLREAAGFDWRVRRHEGISWWQVDTGFEGVELPPEREDLFHAPYRHVGMVPLAGGGHRTFLASATEDGTGTPAYADVERLAREVIGAATRLRHPRFLWWQTPREGRADSWRRGRVLLLGDAARVFPMPVHGLNTGVQDAANLAWKLAAVVLRQAETALLDTYETERRQVAEGLMTRGERVLYAGVSPDPEETLGPILDEGTPRVRTEPPVTYDAEPLTLRPRGSGQHSCAGGWAAPCRVHTPDGVCTVAALQTGGQWLVLSPAKTPLSVAHPLNPRLVTGAQLSCGDRPTIAVIRPDGYMGAEFPYRTGRPAERAVLAYLDRAAAGA
ncbi:FAD-binding protein [Streptomyces albus subsp. chlorinus]|uniref:FAD-dependent monooxygenase n=1 Tax=Streptomyces albus TaxID=1888 RepID=UPI00156EC7D5|nr:FAD-dependent monooxygenase [Streptomyces albus]NSC21548.1 FAD-binding protein [Streptomyces albus subsp. chlorinus]